MKVKVSGMTCANCVRHVQHALEALGVEAEVNLATETATLTGSIPSERAIRKALVKAGYGLGESDEAAGRLRQTIWAAALTAPIVMYTMLWLPLRGAAVPFDGWIVWALATPVQFGPGWTFYKGAWRAARNKSATMDTLVALGTTAAYALSAALVLGGAHAHATYFETAAVIITLIGLGKYFEARAKRSARDALRALLELGAQEATRVRDGASETIPIEDVAVGDHLRVRPGEKVPVDGRIVEGPVYIDESLVTGEADPVSKAAGDPVIGATLAQGGFLMEATRVGEDTTLAQIVRLVEDANARKAPLQRIADRVSGVFVPVVVALAIGATLFWATIGTTLWPAPIADHVFALLIGVSVVVISCPCALGLATPMAILVGTSVGAKHGILIKGGESLERVKDVDIIVLDKTGTITEGAPRVTRTETHGPLDPDFALGLVAAVEEQSEHPLARAVVAAVRARGIMPPVARGFEVVAGLGATATVDGADVMVGSPRFLREAGIEAPDASIVAAIDGVVAAEFDVEDPVKPTSAAAVARLQARGVRVVMLTGDREATAARVAAAVGITEYVAGVLPAEKAAHVERLQKEGVVAMVGDGINDAPALAQADVGVAIGTGTDVAKETGDIVLVKGDLASAVAALDLGRRTVRTIHQNLAWALAYNVALIPVAMGALYPWTGWTLNPMLAGAAMAFSSVSVVANALRLRAVQLN